jgi:TRAP-type transport system periplasmic protein
MWKIAISIIFCSIFFSPAANVLCQEASYVMRIGIGNPEKANSFSWSPFSVFKKEVEERSGGRFRVELYSQSMGTSSLDMVDMVLDGPIHAQDFADGHVSTLYPPLQVLSIPYLFADREIAWEVLDGEFGQLLIEDMAKKTGLRPLYWIENGGFRHYSNNKRPIYSPDDMKGLKIRTMESPVHMKIVSDLGAQAIPIAWGKVYEAIESGIVDGQENSIGTFMIPHFENIQKYIVMDAHVYGTYTLLMNDAWYQKLPEDMKMIMAQAKKVSAAANRSLSVANEREGIKYLKSKGVDIYFPTPDQMEMFKNRTRKSAVEWLRQNVGDEWVNKVLAATQKAEKKLGYRR